MITIKGARENNLKDIDVAIQENRIVGITGVSGSGKSTLAKNIISKYGYKNYAAYLPKSIKNELVDNSIIDVDEVKGLPPTLLIDVVNSISNPRSTLSTVTGLHFTLRKIFSEYGEYRCKKCNSLIENNIWNVIEKYSYRLFIEIKCDNKFDNRVSLLKNIVSEVEIVFFDDNDQITKLKTKKKYAYIYFETEKTKRKKVCEKIYSKLGATVKAKMNAAVPIVIDLFHETYCTKCNTLVKQINLKRFSFNIPYNDDGGACRTCNGFANKIEIDVEELIADDTKSILGGAIHFVDKKGIKYTKITEKFLEAVGKKYGFYMEQPLKELSMEQRNVLLQGSDEVIKYTDRSGANGGKKEEVFQGVANYLLESFQFGKGTEAISPYLNNKICPDCEGTRIDKDFSYIRLDGYSIQDILKMSIETLLVLFENWKMKYKGKEIIIYIDKIIINLKVFNELGCGYLSLDRASITLSGGELQRIRLATFITQNINSTCIVLDEPSTGLHPSDTKKLISVLNMLKERGNSVIVVEHNKFILNACDIILDLGPEGGKNGGEVLFIDSLENVAKYNTYTATYLSTNNKLVMKADTNQPSMLVPLNWEPVYNLKKGECKFPLERLVSICGVSGSGKSTFVKEVLIPYLKKEGKKYNIDKISYMDQKNILKTETSTVGTLLKIMDRIAKLMAKQGSTLESSMFLPNSIKGKCPVCGGKGTIVTDIDDEYELCQACEGKKYNNEVLDVKLGGCTIDDILNISILQLIDIIDDRYIHSICKLCVEAGIGYLTLGRTSKTLSKGEIQRIKLVSLIKENIKNEVLIFDEPTRGLHYHDIENLQNILRAIVSHGNTVVAIEHSMEFITESDHIIEFGPQGGVNGGVIVFEGTPHDLLAVNTSTSRSLNLCSAEKHIENKYIHKQKNNSIRLCNQMVELNKINKLELDKKKLVDLIKKINKKYINAILPIKNRVDVEEEYEVISQFPLMHHIDMRDSKVAPNTKVIENLNIINQVAIMYAKISNSKRQNALHAFNFHSSFGKCKACKGTGTIETVNMDMLCDKDNKWSKHLIDFLTKNSNYTIAVKNLKKTYNIDLTKPYVQMTKDELITMMFGDRTKVFQVKNREVYWPGINKLLKQYRKQYSISKNNSLDLQSHSCYFCDNELVNPPYDSDKISSVSYGEFLSLSLDEIVNRCNKEMPDQLLVSLKLLIKCGLGHISLSTISKELTEEENAIIRLASYCINPIANSILVVSNCNLEKDIELQEFLELSCKYYTVIVC